jgi:sugar/nucleoside kinase (ribokinase family)
MTPRFSRLLHLGNVVVDIVLDVPALPERGGDVLATRTDLTPGGGFNVMAAAARQGLRVAYAGCHGSGPLAELARAALGREHIEVLQPPKPGADTGFVVAVVDTGGERTFITSTGAEATMTSADLAGVTAGPGDAVYLSGYGLVHASNRVALLDWLGRLGGDSMLFADPGPLVRLIPDDVIDQVLDRADWWSCNAREAERLTGRSDPAASVSALAARLGQLAARPRAAGPRAAGRRAVRAPGRREVQPGALVRTGPDGCWLCQDGTDPVHVPGFRAGAVDTNGAGDAHTGAFIAALAGGADEIDAARTANAAGALSVTRRGPATAPTAAELAGFLSAG